MRGGTGLLSQAQAGANPAPSTKYVRKRCGATVPASQPVFLDVQGPLLRSAGLEFELQRTRDWAAVATVAAVCGWGVVGLILCLL